MSFVIIHAFGTSYPFPLKDLSKSTFLSSAFSGRFGGDTSIELNLDPSFKPAFDWIYQSLRESPHTELRPFPGDEFINIIQLAEYLGADSILNEVERYVIYGAVPVNLLIEAYPYYEHDPALRNAAAIYVIQSNNWYKNLPTWAQEWFNFNETPKLPTDFLLVRLIPLLAAQSPYSAVSASQIYPQGYSRRCQTPRQPVLLNPRGLANLHPNASIGRVSVDSKDYNVICSGPDFMNIGKLQSGEACCFHDMKNNIQRIPVDELPTQKRAMISASGFVVYVDPSFQGDYIATDKFQEIPGAGVEIL